MKLKKILPVIALALVLLFFFMPGQQDSGLTEVLSSAAEQTLSQLDELEEESLSEIDAACEEALEEIRTEPAPEEAAVPEEKAEEAPALDEHGSYTTKDDVALYIHTYGHLPDNFVTKKQAEKAGWSGGSLEKYLPGKCIGGSYFGNNEGLLPDAPGRKWTECDINTLGARSRGAERIVFSNDGLIYYTNDHYESFELLYN